MALLRINRRCLPSLIVLRRLWLLEVKLADGRDDSFLQFRMSFSSDDVLAVGQASCEPWRCAVRSLWPGTPRLMPLYCRLLQP